MGQKLQITPVGSFNIQRVAANDVLSVDYSLLRGWQNPAFTTDIQLDMNVLSPADKVRLLKCCKNYGEFDSDILPYFTGLTQIVPERVIDGHVFTDMGFVLRELSTGKVFFVYPHYRDGSMVIQKHWVITEYLANAAGCDPNTIRLQWWQDGNIYWASSFWTQYSTVVNLGLPSNVLDFKQGLGFKAAQFDFPSRRYIDVPVDFESRLKEFTEIVNLANFKDLRFKSVGYSYNIGKKHFPVRVLDSKSLMSVESCLYDDLEMEKFSSINELVNAIPPELYFASDSLVLQPSCYYSENKCILYVLIFS